MKNIRNIFVILFLLLVSCSSNKQFDYTRSVSFDVYETPDLKRRLAQSYFMSAKSYQETNSFFDAITGYLIAADYYPNAQIFHNLGECYLQIGQIDTAINYFETAIKTDSAFTQPYYILTELYDNQNKKDKAIQTVNSLLKYENTEDVKLKLAYLYHNIDIYKSIEIIEGCIKEYGNSDLYLYLKDIYEYLKDNLKILESEEKYLLSDNKSSEMMNKLAEDNISKKNLQNSLKYVDTFKIYCADKTFNNLISEFYPYTIFAQNFELSQSRKLIYLLQNSTLDTNFRNVFLANLHLQMYDSISAIEYYEKSAHTSKNNLLFSIICNVNNHYEQYALKLARSHPDSLIFYSPEQYGILTNLLLSNKQYEIITALYKREYEKDSTRPYIVAGLADVYSIQDKIDSALKYYAIAYEYYPEDPNLLNNYAYFIAILNGDLNKALKYADISITKLPDNPSVMDTYGWINYLLGNYEIAHKYITAALKLLPNSKDGHIHLSCLLLSQGDVAGALVNWIKALRIYNLKADK